MTPETGYSITLKIWDRSTIDSTLETAVEELATRTNASQQSIVVARIGPDTFTVSVSRGADFGDPLVEVPC